MTRAVTGNINESKCFRRFFIRPGLLETLGLHTRFTALVTLKDLQMVGRQRGFGWT
jgi:hypothetical protein